MLMINDEYKSTTYEHLMLYYGLPIIKKIIKLDHTDFDMLNYKVGHEDFMSFSTYKEAHKVGAAVIVLIAPL